MKAKIRMILNFESSSCSNETTHEHFNAGHGIEFEFT